MTQFKRPLGITLISILHTIGGISYIVIGIVFFEQFRRAESALGVPAGLLLCSMGFSTLLSLVSGIGMWKGVWWGWWAGTFNYIYFGVRALAGLLTLPTTYRLLESGELSSKPPGFYLLKFSVRLIMSVFIVAYFYRRNVLAYFGLLDQKRKMASSLAAATIILLGVGIVAGFLCGPGVAAE